MRLQNAKGCVSLKAPWTRTCDCIAVTLLAWAGQSHQDDRLDGRLQGATQNWRRDLLLDEFEMDAESKSCSEAAELL